MGYQWQTLVGGHLGRLGARADGDLQIALRRRPGWPAPAPTMASLDPTPFFAEYGPTGTPGRSSRPTSTPPPKAANPVIAKYLGRLAAADVFTADNAYVMFEALRVDYGMLGPFGDHP